MIVTLAFALLATPIAQVVSQPGSAVCDATWRDEARSRDIPVRIRLPAGVEQVPLVLFSHGLGGTLDAGTTWALAWATAGIAVIHLQHPGSDAGLWAGETTPRGRLAAVRPGMNGQQLVARIGDVKFVLDEVARRRSLGPTDNCNLSRIDIGRVGMAGHSFGAATTQAVAGQRFGGRSLADPRVKAAIAFSPTAPQQGQDALAFGAVTIPFLSVTGTSDTSPGGLNGTVPSDRLRPFAAMPPGKKYLVVYEGGDHQVFGGRGIRRAARPADDHIITSTARLTTLFWQKTLLGGTNLHIDARSVGLNEADKLSAK